MRWAEPAGVRPLFRSIRVRMVVAFSLVFAVVLSASDWMGLQGVPFTGFAGRVERSTDEAFRSLNLIADLNKERMVRWLEERRDDAHVLAENAFIANSRASLARTRALRRRDGREFP